MTRTERRVLPPVLAAACLTTALGCSALGLDDDPSPRAELAEARLRWQERGLVDYDMRIQALCFGVCGPAILRVREGALAAAVDPETGRHVFEFEAFPGPVCPVECLFDIVEEAIESNAEVLDVDYHPVRGHPTRIVIDGRAAVVDDELSVDVLEITSSKVPVPSLSARLEEARNRWESSGITDYGFRLEVICNGCPLAGFFPGLAVTVRGGAVETVRDLRDGEPLPAEVAELVPTIDGLFAGLADASAERVVAEFDPATGIPLHSLIDPDPSGHDDDLVRHVSEFVPAE